MKVWVLTEEYNDYDQYGEYFINVFANKPTCDQLNDAGVSLPEVAHVLNGGGWINRYVEHRCWHLREQELL